MAAKERAPGELRSKFLRIVGLVLLAAATLALLGVAARFLPRLIANTRGLTPLGRSAELSRARTAVLAALGGMIAAVGAYYTVRTFKLNEQGQITERFTRAIDQLGDHRIDVRLGGIYALGRIARESPVDHQSVMEILAGYLREHSPWPTRPPVSPERLRSAFGTDVQAAVAVIAGGTRVRTPVQRLDLRAVDLRGRDFSGAVLLRTTLAGANLSGALLAGTNLREADLSSTDLSDADLANADLGDADLTGACLTNALLRGVSLHGADLSEVDAAGVDFRSAEFVSTQLVKVGATPPTEANVGGFSMARANIALHDSLSASLARIRLVGADLTGADLRNANLSGADLSEADLTAAKLRGADLRKARLIDAKLHGADLTEAILTDADLRCATYDPITRWPRSIDVETTGARLV
jgi:uncharacterized protein YjbI with pentapeptide repeats